MTHLQLNYFKNISKAFSSELSWRYIHTHLFHFGLCYSRIRRQIPGQNVSCWNMGKMRTGILERERVECSTINSSLPSADQEVELGLDGKFVYGNRKGQFGQLVCENGWQVRRMVEKEDELRSVAHIQAEAFHEPVIFFNDLFFQFFQAEVLSGLLYRLRNSPVDRYACLVAEPTNNALEQGHQQLVGVVDVTVLRDEAVLQHLPGADEYIYVSGIAVLHSFRRKKVATVLLKACEMLSVHWGFEYLVLRAYEDDWGARKLYTNAGYMIVSGDSPWMTTWIGRRRRLLMIKRST